MTIRRFAITAIGALLLLAGFSAEAMAISRADAEQLALDTLGTETKPAPIALFGTGKASKPKGGELVITEPDSSAAKLAKAYKKERKRGELRFRSRVLYRSNKPAWIFWEDLEHGAMFEHDSQVLVIDDRSGKVVAQKTLRWYPVINDKLPPWLKRSADYFGGEHKVFASPAPLKAPAGRGPSPAAVAAAGQPETVQANDPASVVRDHLKGERACFVSVVNRGDRRFRPDISFLEFAIPAAGYSAYEDVEPLRGHTGPDGKGLQDTVRKLVNQHKCKSVTVYVSGHGWDQRRLVKGKKLPANVDMGRNTAGGVTTADVVTAEDLRDLFEAHPKVEFTLVVNACFAGSFGDEFNDNPSTKNTEEFSNVEQTVFSSSATQKSWFAGSLAGSPNPTQASEFLYAFVRGLVKFRGDKKEANNAWIETKNHPSFAAYMAERAYRLGLPDYFPDAVPAGQRGHTDSESDTRGNTVTDPATVKNAGGDISYDPATPSTVNLEVAIVADGISELRLMVPPGAGQVNSVGELSDDEGNTYACSAATTEQPFDTYSCSGSMASGMYEGSFSVNGDPYYPMETASLWLLNGEPAGPFEIGAPSAKGYAQSIGGCDGPTTIANGIYLLNALFQTAPPAVCSFAAGIGEGKGGTVDYEVGISTGSQLDVSADVPQGTWVSFAGMRNREIPRFGFHRSSRLPLMQSNVQGEAGRYWSTQLSTATIVAGGTPLRQDQRQARRQGLSSRLDFKPDCSGATSTLQSVAIGALIADPGGGNKTLKRLRKYDGGAAAVNAQLVGPPEFGTGGKLTLEYAGCGKLALKAFIPLKALGLGGKVDKLPDKVAAQLVEVKDRGKKAKGTKVEALSEADRLLNPTPDLGTGAGSSERLAGLSVDYTKTNGTHRVQIAPRGKIVRFVAKCLRDGGKPVFFKETVDGKRLPFLGCK